MTKKIFRVLSLFLVFTTLSLSVSLAQNNGVGGILDKFGGGIGVGDNDGNGNADWNDAAGNWAEGVGEDILTDTFGNTGIGPIPDGEFKLPCPDEFNVIGQNTSARKFILNVVNFGLSFLGLIAVVMVIYAGFLYVTDAGEGSGSEKAKKIIQYALTGILIILGSFALVNTVIKYAGVGGNDSASSVTSSTGFADELLLSECGDDGNLKHYGKLTGSGLGFVKDFGNGMIVRSAEEVLFTVDNIPDEFGSPETYIWTFGNGVYGTDAEAHTFFTDGWHDIGVIIKNTEGKIIRIFTKVYVGSPVEARFFSSSLRPKSQDTVEFNASASVARIGNIATYEWTCEKISSTANASCFAPTTGQRINKKFVAVSLDTEFKVTLTVTSSIDPNVQDSVSEIIKVSSGASPQPEIVTTTVTHDPDNDELFKVKAWVNDPVDNPIKNFRFEVWEGGQKLTQKSSTFGVNVADASGVSQYQQVEEGYVQTFTEILIDLKDHRGRDKDLRFRTIARNTMGGEDIKDYSLNNVDIGLMNNTPPSGWIQVSPSKVGNLRTVFQFFGMGTDNQADPINYTWKLEQQDPVTQVWSDIPDLTGRNISYQFDTETDYRVTLTMADVFTEDNDSSTFNTYQEIITVQEILLPNTSPAANNAPVIQTLGCLIDGKITTNGMPGDQLVCSPRVSDAEYHPLMFDWRLTPTTGNGQIIQTFDQDFTYYFTDETDFTLELRVKDIPPVPPYEPNQALSDSASETITVSAVPLPTNNPPVIQFVNISPEPDNGNNFYSDETTFTYSVMAIDPENDPLEYKWCFIGQLTAVSGSNAQPDTCIVTSEASGMSPTFRYKNKFNKADYFDLDSDQGATGYDTDNNGEKFVVDGRVYVREKGSRNWRRAEAGFKVGLVESDLSNSKPVIEDLNCRVNNITQVSPLDINVGTQVICDPIITDDENHPLTYKWTLTQGSNVQVFNGTPYFAYDFNKLGTNNAALPYTIRLDVSDVPPSPPFNSTFVKAADHKTFDVTVVNPANAVDNIPLIKKVIITPDPTKNNNAGVTEYTFDAIAIDPEGEGLEYEWTITLYDSYDSDGVAKTTPTIQKWDHDNDPSTTEENKVIIFKSKSFSYDFATNNEAGFSTPLTQNGEIGKIDVKLVVTEVDNYDGNASNENSSSPVSKVLNIYEENFSNLRPVITDFYCTDNQVVMAGTKPEVTENHQINCTVLATDPDGHPLDYEWELVKEDANTSLTATPPIPPTIIRPVGFARGSSIAFIANDGLSTVDTTGAFTDWYNIKVTVKDIPPANLNLASLSANDNQKYIVKERDSGVNNRPTVKIHVYPDQRNTPIEGNTNFSFYAEADDPENDALEYEWNFGDGNFSSLATPSHDYRDTTTNFFAVLNNARTVTYLTKAQNGELGEIDVNVKVTEKFNPLIHATVADVKTSGWVKAVVELQEKDPINNSPEIMTLGIEDGYMSAKPGEYKAFAPEINDVNEDGSPDVIDTFEWKIFKFQEPTYTNGVLSWTDIGGTLVPESFSTRNINAQFLTEGRYSVYLKVTDDEGKSDEMGTNDATASAILSNNDAEIVKVLNNFDNAPPYIKYLNNQPVRSAVLDESITLTPQIFDADYVPTSDQREYQWFIFEGDENSNEKPITVDTTETPPAAIGYVDIKSAKSANYFADFAPNVSGSSTVTPNIPLATPIIFDASNALFSDPNKDTFYFDVSLRVIDTKNGIKKEHIRTRKIVVKRPADNQAPEIIRIDPSTGYNGALPDTVVSFIPMTVDKENDVLRYEWVIKDESGTVLETFDRRNITYQFTQEGDYFVGLTIKELYTEKKQPHTDSIAVFRVSNNPINNTAPNIFSLGQSPTPNVSRLDQLSTFNPIIGDAENDVLTYDWEIKNPSGAVVHTATTKNMFYVFDTLGDYEVTLTVTEDQASLDNKYGVGMVTALSDPKTETVTVSAAPAILNEPPKIIHLGLLPSNAGITSQTLFTFNPIVIDPDGDILTYVWDFGDGVSAYYKDTSHMYHQAKKFKATLTVSDGYNTVMDDIWITVVDPNTPVPTNEPPVITELVALPGNTGTVDDKFTLFAKAVDPDQDPLTYQWDFDTGAKTFSQNTSYQFTDPGEYEATVTVSDGIHQVSRGLKFTIVPPGVEPPPSTVDNLPPIIHSLRPSPGNTGDLRTIFSFQPLVSDPENDPLRYEWHFGNTHRMYSKNVAYRYPMPGNWHTELFVSDGTHTVSKPITIQVVPVGTPIPPSTTPVVYIGENPSNLVPGDISIATKADLELELGELQFALDGINLQIEDLKDQRDDLVQQREDASQQLLVLQNDRAQIVDRLNQLNNPGYIQQLITDAQAAHPLLQEKYALLAQTTDPAARAQLLAEIAALEAQIEAQVLEDVAKEKETLTKDLSGIDAQIAALMDLIKQLDASIFDIDKQIFDLEAEAAKLLAQIQSLDNTLSGDYLIEGSASGEYSSAGTKFFLYGNLPMETNRPIFVEWESGDGRNFVGQDATLRYPEDGLYNAKLIVTDGVTTVSDTIGIKINPRRAVRRR